MSATKEQNNVAKASSYQLLIIIVAIALALTVLIWAASMYSTDPTVAGYFLLFGFLLLLMTAYVLFQARRKRHSLKIEAQPVSTTIECKKCGFKSVREFQRGDYIFKEAELCQKCNEKMMITAIFREVKEKE